MNPARDLRALLDELGLSAAALGVELDSYGLKAHHWRQVEAELAGRRTLSRRLHPDRRSALREEPAGDRVRPPRRGARRRRLGRSGAARPSRRLRGRHPRRHAGRGVPRRGRLRRKRVHHRIGPGRSAVPVLQRPPAPRPGRPAHPGVRGCVSALPRRDDAHPAHRARPSGSTSRCTPPVSTRSMPAWRRFARGGRWARSSPRTPGCWTRRISASTA